MENGTPVFRRNTGGSGKVRKERKKETKAWMSYTQPKKVKIQKTKETMERIAQRGYFYIEGTYENKSSPLIVFCPHHGTEHVTTFTNYKRSRTGCPCCGRMQTSTKLVGREYSQETINKQSKAAQLRPKRGGKPRRWREQSKYRGWRQKILKNHGYKCAISGKKENLECHHLYGTNKYTDLIYVPENGIVLAKEIHASFHNFYGYRDNTLEQFESFLLTLTEYEDATMLISSQAVDRVLKELETRKKSLQYFFNESTEGSETRW